jgi:hypothetical protein
VTSQVASGESLRRMRILARFAAPAARVAVRETPQPGGFGALDWEREIV